MPYGVKRGVRAPGEYRAGDLLGLALAGSAGLIAALVTDYQQSGESSALYTVNQWVVAASRIFGFGDVPLWAVVAGLIALGAGSTFYFQPITRQGAFAQGFGLLAVLMTLVPSDLAGGLESYAQGGDDLPGLEPAAYFRGADDAGQGAPQLVPASYAAGEARLYQAQATRAARYDVQIIVNFPNGLPAEIDSMIRRGTIRGRLHNENTGETYNLFRSAGGSLEKRGNQLLIRAGVPARAQEATLWVRVEIEKYAIEQQSTTARLGAPLEWRIDMRPSSTPLFMQRLNNSYWF